MNGIHFLLRGFQGKQWFLCITHPFPSQYGLAPHYDWHFRSQVGTLQIRNLLVQYYFYGLE